jgi:hypothetical protein
LPDRDAPIAPEITSNPKFSSFFDNAIGAIDGTQVNSVPSSTERQNAHDHKGGIMHNVLACCSFDLWFQYFLSGSDGIAADSGMFTRVQASNLTISPGKYYLANARFVACSAQHQVCFALLLLITLFSLLSGPLIKRNFSIFDTLVHAMSLSIFSAYSKGASQFSPTYLSTT